MVIRLSVLSPVTAFPFASTIRSENVDALTEVVLNRKWFQPARSRTPAKTGAAILTALGPAMLSALLLRPAAGIFIEMKANSPGIYTLKRPVPSITENLIHPMQKPNRYSSVCCPNRRLADQPPFGRHRTGFNTNGRGFKREGGPGLFFNPQIKILQCRESRPFPFARSPRDPAQRARGISATLRQACRKERG